MIRVDVHPKCVHFGLGLESYGLGLGLGLGLATPGLDYIPDDNVRTNKRRMIGRIRLWGSSHSRLGAHPAEMWRWATTLGKSAQVI